MDDILQKTAQFVSALSIGAIPDNVRLCALRAFADTVGCVVAGSDSPQVSMTAHAIGAPEGVCGSLTRRFPGAGREKTSLLDAALLDGVGAHSLEYNDLFYKMPGHPSAVIVPAALALSDELDLSGEEVFTAYIAGFEVLSRINSSLMPAHHEKGFHSTSAAGIIGAAACCARLLGFDTARIAQAISLACTFACGLRRNFGSFANSLHVGNAAQGGLRAALLVREGITADPEMLTAADGYINAFYGSVDKLRGLCDDFGLRWAFTQPGLLIKKYPACYSTYQAADAALALVRDGVDIADIAHIDCETCELTYMSLPAEWASDTYSRRFCVPYCVAAALRYKKLDRSCFKDELAADGALESLRPLISYRVAAELVGKDGYGFTDVVITTHDGRVLRKRECPRDSEKVDAWSAEALERKFVECCSPFWGGKGGSLAYSKLMRLSELDSIREVTRADFSAHR